MEADENGVTAKNTYGGPLLLRTVFGDIETTYQYLYNAHGDVVTLLTDGEVVATYYYDSFGNVLEQTGEVSNSILYAGYQYDEETGLYYINARMYDPVTARFLQADTYLGSLNDPLSLNLYTYCLNNPHKYTDPSGHFVITAAAVLLAARIATSLVSGVLSAKAEYDRQVAEGDNYADWTSILFVGGANAGLSFATFGIGSGAVKGAGVGAKLLFKHLGKAVVRDAAIGALMDAGIETARQLVTGTKITNLEYDRINEAGVMGGIIGGGSTIAGAALEGLAKTRVVKSAVAKVKSTLGKGAKVIKNEFVRLVKDNSGFLDLDAFKKSSVTESVEEIAENSNTVVAKPNQGQGFSPKGYIPKNEERTLQGYVNQNVSQSAEVSLYTKSSEFNNVGAVGGEFKRFGTVSGRHGIVGPHVHQPIRNVNKVTKEIRGGAFNAKKGVGVDSPNRYDIKHLYQYLENGKYHE